MSLFNKNRINVKKEINGHNIKFFVDYYRLKESKEFKLKLIRDLIGKNHSLVVVDTNFAYKNVGVNIEEEVNELMKLLDKHSISYRKVTIKNDASLTILGIPVKLNGVDKVKKYIVGLIISAGELQKIGYVVDKFNAYYYVGFNTADGEELLNKFNSAGGDMEELKDMFKCYIYNDNFTNQTRICSKDETTEFIEEILQRQCASANNRD